MKTLVTMRCKDRPMPSAEEYYEPREWSTLIAREDLERALASEGKICRVATYRPDGEKTLHMLDRLTPGLRRAWENKHSDHGMIHLCYLLNENGQHITP